MTNLRELRVTFSSYSDDRYYLDPIFSSVILDLEEVKIMIRASWDGWDSLSLDPRPLGAYWNALEGKVPDLRGNETCSLGSFLNMVRVRIPACNQFHSTRELLKAVN